MIRFFIGLVLALWMALGAAIAQEPPSPIYEGWEDTASRAEEVLEEGRASSEALEVLRRDLAQYREQFLAAESSNNDRIETLQSQIDALGEAPAEGESEPPEITQRRAELTDQLSRLRAPVIQAEEAFTRADGLISEIDSTIRSRQADQLFRLGPSPLNPVSWTEALNDLTQSVFRTLGELRTSFSSPVALAEARSQLPATILLALFGIVLILLSQRWMKRLVDYLRNLTKAGTGVWSIVLSIGQILITVSGVLCVSFALTSTQLFGPRSSELLLSIPGWILALLVIHWLADQSFHPNDNVATLPLEHEGRKRARRVSWLLGLVLVLEDILDTVVVMDDYSAASRAVADFPIIVLAGYMLYRLGGVRNTPTSGAVLDDQSSEDHGLFRLRLARLLGRAAMIVGVVGPILAAVGFNGIGEAMIFPSIMTLALIAVVLVLQRVVSDIFTMITGKTDAEAASLWPVLGGFVIILAAMPLLVLIWGGRVADLTELWARFQGGFMIGDNQFRPSDLLVIVVVFALGYTLTRLLQSALRSAVLPKTKIDQGGQNAIVAGLGYVGIFLASIVAVTAAGIDLSSLALVAGALSLGIGFGLQNIVQNFVSGIILLIERPIGEGDWIEVGGQHGTVKNISVRSTRIETFDRFDVIVPNADLVSGQVRNYTRGNTLGRIIVPVGVAYGTDTRMVEKILLDIARRHEMVLMNPEPFVYFAGFGADSLDFEIRVILRDVTAGLVVRTEMRHLIVERFQEAGIEIPFAQRDVWLRNPEVLRAPPAGEEAVPRTGESEPQVAAPKNAPRRAGDDDRHEDSGPMVEGSGEADR